MVRAKVFTKWLAFIMAVAMAFIVTGCSQGGDTSSSDDKSVSVSEKENQPVISFANMSVDNQDLNLTDAQKEVIKYFDNNYFEASVEDMQRYPDVFKGAQVKITGKVVKVLQSTDTEFSALVREGGYHPDYDDVVPYEDSTVDPLFVVNGQQTSKRVIENDAVTIYGRYVNVESYDIDGTSYSLPTISAFSINNYFDAEHNIALKFDYDTISAVAKAIFGENVKIKEQSSAGFHIAEPSYLVTLDNQSVSDFDTFVFNRNTGYVSDLRNYESDSSGTYTLYIAADLEHFIIMYYEPELKHLYLEYYDKDLVKVWSREFDNVESIPMDYTMETIALVADNDLYFIDTDDGQDRIEPVLVGSKCKVFMDTDGVLLVGDKAKDMFMKVDYNGNITWRVDGKYDGADEWTQLQIVNDNYVVCWSGVIDSNAEFGNIQGVGGYTVIDKDGNILLETE